MLIRIINPNTTESMTRLIGRSATQVAAPGTVVDAVTSPMGPASIESHYDEALSVPGLLAAIAEGEAAGAAAHVIACFGDPGLLAAREVAAAPVVGIAEAAMHAATLLGRGFSVVTTLPRTFGHTWDIVRSYGFGERCLGVHACDIPVLELEDNPEAEAAIVRACEAALAADGSDAVVLGCAGMAQMCGRITTAIGLPVIDGVAAAVVMAEGLVRMGLRTGKAGEFARPPAKAYRGRLAGFALG